jgi:hypothetical protein
MGCNGPRCDETGAVVGNLATAFETTTAVRERADRSRTERALHESEARLKAAAGLVGLGWHQWEPDLEAWSWMLAREPSGDCLLMPQSTSNRSLLPSIRRTGTSTAL